MNNIIVTRSSPLRGVFSPLWRVVMLAIPFLTSFSLAAVMTVAAGYGSDPPTSQPAEPPASQPAPPEMEAADEQLESLLAKVDEALGGKEAWEAARVLRWNFFGSRMHYWDKHTGDVRIEWQPREGDPVVVLMNLHTREGAAYQNGEELEGEARDAMLQRGYGAWVNDSYWLIMPYKLRDPGVNLEMLDEAETLSGDRAHVLAMTYEDGTGLTPGNKYHVYVDPDSHLVVQWDFFRTADQTEPDIQTAWQDWKEYHGIMLSGDRGEMRGRRAQLTDIAVFSERLDSIFTDPGEVVLDHIREPG